MTSTCSQSATPATAAASSASLAKSADRMLGAIWTAMPPSLDAGTGPARVAPGVVPGYPGRVPGAPRGAARVSPTTASLRSCIRQISGEREEESVNSERPDALLDRVRKLLVKAEADGVTQAEAQALTAKAAELMAKYGIDRALLAAARPETDRPADRIIDIGNPWARVQAHLLCGLAAALRCQCVILPKIGRA